MLYISLIIADASDEGISISIADTEDGRRLDLIAHYNQCVADGGLADDAAYLPDDAPITLVTETIEDMLGRPVVLKEWPQ